MIKVSLEKTTNDEQKATEMLGECKLKEEDLIGRHVFDALYTPNLSEEQEGKLLYNVVEGERTTSLPSVEEIESKTRTRISKRKKKGRTPYVAKLDLSPQTQSRSSVPYTWAYFGHMDITSRDYHYGFLWAYYHPDVGGFVEIDYVEGQVTIKVEYLD
jgi:hypothetical protein